MEKIVEGNKHRGRGGGGQIVNVLAFYSDDSSLNPTRVFLKNCDWKRNIINL